ncbi:MAG: SRPBCC domain-containing protein, partial [bacterium]
TGGIMSVEFEVSVLFPTSPQVVYDTWLDFDGHAAMTGFSASIKGEIGNESVVGEGYITGMNLELIPGKLIRQFWHTQEFDDSNADSELTITLESEEAGTRLTLRHTNLPDHGMQYKDGWV